MKISDQIGLAVTNLSRRKGRTALTVVGVVVGICAVHLCGYRYDLHGHCGKP